MSFLQKADNHFLLYVLFTDEKYQKSPAQNLTESGQFPPLKNFNATPTAQIFLYATEIDNNNVNILMPECLFLSCQVKRSKVGISLRATNK